MVWREECEKIEEALFLRERATDEIRTEGRRGVFTSPPTYMTITVDIVSVSPHPPSLSPSLVPRSSTFGCGKRLSARRYRRNNNTVSPSAVLSRIARPPRNGSWRGNTVWVTDSILCAQ